MYRCIIVHISVILLCAQIVLSRYRIW